MNSIDLRDFIRNIDSKSNEWREFLAANQLNDEHRARVLETLALLLIAKKLCITILENGSTPGTSKFFERLLESLKLLVKVYEVLEDKIDVGNLPGLPF